MSAQLLNYAEAAALLGIKTMALRRLVQTKQVPHTRLGKSFVRFEADELKRWLAACRVAAESSPPVPR